MAALVNIIPGSASTFRYEITHSDGCDAFDLTDYAVSFFIKRSLQDLDNAAEFAGALDDGILIVFERRDGIVDVIVPSQVTSNLRIGRSYPFYLRVTSVADASVTFTPFRGEFLPVLPRDE